MKGFDHMYCIYNESRISWRQPRHVRQFKESQDGIQRPFLRDNRAIIDIINDSHYIARASTGEVIAISDIIVNVIARIRYAQPSAVIDVIYQGERIALERYHEITAPAIYRIQHSNSVNHGELVAMNVYKNGKQGDIKIFEDVETALEYIESKQGAGNNDYYVFSTNRNILEDARERQLGMNQYEITDNQRDNESLKREIQGIRREQDAELEALLDG